MGLFYDLNCMCSSFLCVNGRCFVQATAIFEVLDNLLIDGNMESFEELRDEAGSQRVLDNVERYALYVARVLQEEGENVIINQTGDNIGMYIQHTPCQGSTHMWYISAVEPL